MTVGIYELKFSDGSVYIGQSINIQKRKIRHLYSLKYGVHHNKLVQNKYDLLGTPNHTILIECDKEELCDKEIWYCSQVPNNLLLNLSEPGQKTTILHGVANGRSKYSKEEILEVLFCLANSDISKKELAEFSPISYTMIRQISSGTAHSWMKDEYPEEYKRMVNKTKRNPVFYVKDPKGIVHEVKSQRSFVHTHDISLSSLNHLATGKIASAKGWTLV